MPTRTPGETLAIDKAAVGRRIRDTRLALGLRYQSDLLERCHGEVSGGALSRWETGKRLPDPHSLRVLSRALGVSADWLLTGAGQRTTPPTTPAPTPPPEPSTTSGVPVGRAALERMLDTYPWPPDILPDRIDEIARMLLTEAETPAGRLRYASMWKARADRLVAGGNGKSTTRPVLRRKAP